MTNLVSRQFGSVLIYPFRKFWVAVLIITLFTIPQTASGVDYKKAEFHPVVNSKGVGVIDPSDEIVNKFYLGESLRLLPIKNDWDDRTCVRRKYLRDGVIDGRVAHSKFRVVCEI